MEIGKLRHRIIFQQTVKVDDTYKGHEVTWANFVTVWADVEPLTGREYFFSQQVKAEVTHRVKIRYRDDITVKMRILFGTRVLGVESIFDIKERHKTLEIFCREEK